MNFGTNFENVVYCYLNHHPDKFKLVDDDFFKSPIIKRLVKLSKEFYDRYHETLYDVNNPNIGQIRALVLEDPDSYQIDANNSSDNNVKQFLDSTKYVIETTLSNYSQEWLHQTVEAWVVWKNNEKGYKLSVQYMQTQNVTPENVISVISKAKDIVIRRSNVTFDDTDVIDFFDPNSHKQISIDNYIDTGYRNLNKFFCGNYDGGIIPSTVNMFVGGTNSGKSIILGNLAKNIAYNGDNVMLVSLEMDIDRIFRRIGSNAFDIPIQDYDNFGNNTDLVSESIRSSKSSLPHSPGTLLAVRYSNATVSKIFAKIKTEEERRGIKINVLILDYFTELENEHGISPDNMYSYHKSNINDLYRYAKDMNITVITAHQMKLGKINNSDISMADVMSESSAIVYRCDSVIGLINTEQMRIERCIYFKNIKARESSEKNYYSRFDIDYSKMRITESGDVINPENYQVFTV